ncbi:unnamed protein product [Sphenostylis stenocarpa]|uniref:Uncharacterized protein n=1 Tax=Sphenostylis stenocarpa TaxID=92480 RepID=A0AA86TC07_9FABA|nr:unnamed protein product [Sphenostylis stenocarpa]
MGEVEGLKQGAKIRGNGKRKGDGFSNKCASLVKEQRARIYILRRCATMLLFGFAVVSEATLIFSRRLFLFTHLDDGGSKPLGFYGDRKLLQTRFCLLFPHSGKVMAKVA